MSLNVTSPYTVLDDPASPQRRDYTCLCVLPRQTSCVGLHKVVNVMVQDCQDGASMVVMLLGGSLRMNRASKVFTLYVVSAHH
jgi:hypothetical protein